ncbi:MAG: hypothetical protein MUF04_06605 [Akkermansiaceae bacterium]|jgi:hypothetical protein|nr:hypothetical protein [Akkermansiaceae bacterium]
MKKHLATVLLLLVQPLWAEVAAQAHYHLKVVGAIRDSDGTELSPDLLELAVEVLSTVLLTRADQAYARGHPEFLIR